MRIKRLDITGFKSFMDRSVFSFDDGVTGVVGPNGCGKSNVVDAIRWAMGEQSAKNLRGRGMEDVIFNGSETKPPLSMAEVTLTFKVEAHDVLAPQYAGLTDVSVTRRLFRSGESEYLINKTVCRLLDITELFLGTGVGTRAYSIIEQGRVGLIVSAKPEDRRTFIEEAAGITKYKARRKAAERKMEYTQQNLLRVKDIVSELEKRLETLQRQAKKAEKYKKLRAQAREIELHSASHKYLALHAERQVLGHRLTESNAEEQQHLAEVHALEGSIESRRQHLEMETAALESLTSQVHALEGQVQLDAQTLEHSTSDADATQRRLAQAKAEAEALSTRERELLELLAQRTADQSTLTGASKEDDANVQLLQDELKRVVGQQAELAQRLEQERAQLVALAGRLANHEANLINLERRRAELEERRVKSQAEVEALRTEERALDLARTDVQDRVGLSRQLALELAERKGQEEEALVKTREAFAENEVLVISLREELADKRSRLSSLEEIQHSYEGFDRGVRAVMLKAGTQAREQGIFGLVADVLTTSPNYEKAIEAALGERLQHVIVEDREKGLELLRYLKGLAEGRSSFLPVRRDLPEPEAVQPPLDYPGVLGAAFAQVHCEPALEPLVKALLRDVVILSDLDAAQEFARGPGALCTLVTLEGEVLRPDGGVTGGALEGPAVGALQKKREIAELTAEVARVEERYNEIVTRHYGLQKQMGHTEGVLKGLAKNQHAEELNLASQEKDLHKAAEDLAKLRDRLAALEKEEEQLVQSLQALGGEEEAARGEVAHGQTERQTREERVRQLVAESETSKAKTGSLSDDLTALRVRVASNVERVESARKEVEQLEAQRAELRSRLARLEESVTESSERLAALDNRLTQTESTRLERAERLATLQRQLEEERHRHHESSSVVREEELRLRERRFRLDELTQGLSQISLRERELSLELEHLVAQISERHQVELRHALHDYHWRAQLLPETEHELKELRGQLDRMGEINLTAIDEHAELSTRFEFLSGQQKDLIGSLEQLESAIVKIDKTSRERFKQTFEVVNEKFQQIFPRLFGGGRAALSLTQEGPNGEPGVEILAQPPGKKLQSVSLLSGGEKALTAVSLIFAIFLIKPTPFCLLDEVDAPLDEANVGRYNEMVREMSKQSQFIVITHNKRTMEVVDTLYGVTMEEPGISKLVSVRLHEVAAANTDQVA